MSAIVESLNQLNAALERLETAALQQQEQKRQAPKSNQQDLFGSASSARSEGAANINGSVVSIDPALLAKKLDIAIERVEQVLREG